MLTRLHATFNRVESGSVVLTLEDGQELRVPKEDLQPLPSIGSEFTLQLLPSTEAELAANDLAKCLLNQLLDDEKDE